MQNNNNLHKDAFSLAKSKRKRERDRKLSVQHSMQKVLCGRARGRRVYKCARFVVWKKDVPTFFCWLTRIVFVNTDDRRVRKNKDRPHFFKDVSDLRVGHGKNKFCDETGKQLG